MRTRPSCGRVLFPGGAALVGVLMLTLQACRASRPAAVSTSSSQVTDTPRRVPPPRALVLAAADLVQFRWEATAPPTGSRFIDPQTGAPVALSDTVVLDLAGIDSAWAWRRARDTSDSWDVLVRLSRAGSAAFGATTATHTGRRLAVLVDGRVTLMPWVEGAIGPRAMIARGVRRPEADSLAARLDTMIAALRPFLPVRLH